MSQSQAAADRALLRDAMIRDQLEDWIERAIAPPKVVSPEEFAALERLRSRGPVVVRPPLWFLDEAALGARAVSGSCMPRASATVGRRPRISYAHPFTWWGV